MKKKKNTVPMIVLEAVMILLALIVLFPIILMFLNSVKTLPQVTVSMISLPTQIHLENFSQAFTKMNYLSAFKNSVIITIASVSGLVFISSMAAYQIVRKKCIVSKILFYGIVLLSMAIPFQALMVPLVIVAKNLGLINKPYGLIVMYWGFLLPLAMFLYHGFIKSLPRELEEAAQIDGCGQISMFFKIVFPLLKPITTTVIIINTLNVFNDFSLPLIMLSSNNTRTIPLAMSVFNGAYLGQWNLSFAALTITLVPILIFFLFAQRYIMQGLTDGAVKG